MNILGTLLIQAPSHPTHTTLFGWKLLLTMMSLWHPCYNPPFKYSSLSHGSKADVPTPYLFSTIGLPTHLL